MRLPPKWVRRLLLDPAVVLAVAVAVVSLPIWVFIAFILSRYLPGKLRILRIAGFLFLYLLVEAAALIALFLLWVASGFGWKIRSSSFRHAHYRLLAWMLRTVVRWAKRAFRLRVVVDDPRDAPDDETVRTAVVVLSRHAGPGDSILLMDALMNEYGREPRIVLKEFMQWDPTADVVLNRLPTAFVPAGPEGREALVEKIKELAGSMDSDDAFVIFPEGANYTERRRAGAIRKLRKMGRPDLAERAENLQQTLPPRSVGVQAVLAAAQANIEVVFVGHAGLETLITPADIWRAIPMDTVVAVKLWPFSAESLPPPAAQEEWLYDTWAAMDEWIGARLADTEEPAPDSSPG